MTACLQACCTHQSAFHGCLDLTLKFVSRCYPKNNKHPHKHTWHGNEHMLHALQTWMHKKNTLNGAMVLSVQMLWCREWYVMAWRVGQALRKPGMPLYRLEDYSWKRYKDHREWMHGFQMVIKTICNAKLFKTPTCQLGCNI